MVWNTDLAPPEGDWLIRLDAKADILYDDPPGPASPGFATLGGDFHDTLGSHVQFETATLHGDKLKLQGTITESKNPDLAGQSVLIQGKVEGTAVQGLTVTIGGSVFSGAGLLVVIAIIAILIG